MADNEQKAMQLMAEAEKKLNSSKGFFGSLFGGSSKLEEAVECYQRAANMFKMAKKWGQAGNAFCEAANLHAKSGSRHDAATNFVDAANCYKKSEPERAVASLLRAIEIYTDMGRFTMAAKHHQSIAELYETENVDLERAVQHYEQAADYFKGEESNSSANKCLLKVAHYAAQLEDYEKAIKIYEQVAATSLDSSLLKYSAKEYFFRAALCHLCVDVLNAQHALERYQSMYPGFQDSREYKLIKVLIDHMEEQNVDGFTEAVKDYDSISRLDQWYTTILLRIKKQVNDNPDLR
ncbi:alpha-soluble NSF attachment protein [Schistocerca piceifrons]|uniref:alpha-soluble NSF attachment protein n=1 Tax=Schistocerca piceifrons TaxID=274613 RepID=UPI001F5E6B4C|nr:alpha-soluble NSF attachment protein [Schistocerca piceifrons]XP_049784056.1 alpha-soluble NSF attachment protein [Schistocerca cancellata]XP_049805496.1 alpha-soluble NSF attachment protein [Schistocerca nitens]XP_049954034.1 alpha-soluble NSF attachment protein [Schistocerca serialis cubense]